MDRVTALIVIAQFRLRLNMIERYPHLLENLDMPTPNLQGLTQAMDMLEHDLETDAGALLTKVQSVRARGKTAIGKGHQRIDGVASRVDQVEKFVAAVEGSNGGDPLDRSLPTSQDSGGPTNPNGSATPLPPNNIK